MRRWLTSSALVALAACGPGAAPERAETEGGAARVDMESAVKAFAACIEEQAQTMPLADEPAGTLAINAVRMCSGPRADLVEKVAAFNAIGYPSRTPEQVQAVAEASVKVLEDEARQAAVVTIVKRQTSPETAAPEAGAPVEPAS